MKSTDPKSNERTAIGSSQGELPCGTGASEAHTAKVNVHKLSAECPAHGTVPVVCPRCAGTAGGKAHRGTQSRRKKELEALETVRRTLDLEPAAQTVEAIAEDRRECQELAANTGDDAEYLFARLSLLPEALNYLRRACDQLRMSPEERAKLLEEMQKTVALALSSPGEVMASLDRRRPMDEHRQWSAPSTDTNFSGKRTCRGPTVHLSGATARLRLVLLPPG